MAYNVITKDQVLNGLPLDQDVFSTALENQEFLKSEADLNDDLSALNRDIVPAFNGSFDLGEMANQFANSWIQLMNTDRLVLAPGLTSNLSLVFSDSATTGLYSPSTGALRFKGNGYDALDIDSARTKLFSASRAQLHLESTSTGFEAVHTLGADSNGFIIRETTSGSTDLFEVSQAATKLYSQLEALAGTESAPGLSFAGATDSGIFQGAGKIGITVDGTERLSIGQDLVINAEKTVFPNGSEASPSVIFEGNEFSGFSYDNVENNIDISINGQSRLNITNTDFGFATDNPSQLLLNVATSTLTEAASIILQKNAGTQEVPAIVRENELLGDLTWIGIAAIDGTPSEVSAKICGYASEDFGQFATGSYLTVDTTNSGETTSTRRLEIGFPGAPTFNVLGSIGAQKKVLNLATAYVEEDVQNFSVLKVDTSANNVILSTLGGGADTQILFIFKSDPANTFTIQHNSAATGQKILTQNETDLVLGTGYGGVTLINDEGTWKELSIS